MGILCPAYKLDQPGIASVTKSINKAIEGAQRVHISTKRILFDLSFCVSEVGLAGALWEGHTLLKTGLSARAHTHRQTDRQTDNSENIISASFTPFTWRI